MLDETNTIGNSEFCQNVDDQEKNTKHGGTGFSRSSGCCHFYSSIKVHMSNMLFPPPHYVRACIPSIQQLSVVTQAYGINLFLCLKLIELTHCIYPMSPVIDVPKAYRFRMDQAKGGKGWH